mmetsp:Transcript_4950/g.10070  ORF Transcript_4950/g.10070 Transcript_4950/m.10070 type:complete len:213 (-) Transcript_4950:1332-1970(-)
MAGDMPGYAQPDQYHQPPQVVRDQSEQRSDCTFGRARCERGLCLFSGRRQLEMGLLFHGRLLPGHRVLHCLQYLRPRYGKVQGSRQRLRHLRSCLRPPPSAPGHLLLRVGHVPCHLALLPAGHVPPRRGRYPTAVPVRRSGLQELLRDPVVRHDLAPLGREGVEPGAAADRQRGGGAGARQGGGGGPPPPARRPEGRPLRPCPARRLGARGE